MYDFSSYMFLASLNKGNTINMAIKHDYPNRLAAFSLTYTWRKYHLPMIYGFT